MTTTRPISRMSLRALTRRLAELNEAGGAFRVDPLTLREQVEKQAVLDRISALLSTYAKRAA